MVVSRVGSLVKLGSVFPGTLIEFDGRQRRTVRRMKTNYLLVDRDGTEYKLNLNAPVTILPSDAWGEDEGHPTATAVEVPYLVVAQEVRLVGRNAGKFDGKTGYISKVNATTYSVLIPNVGIVNASHRIVQAI